jgi:hypothetical protein
MAFRSLVGLLSLAALLIALPVDASPGQAQRAGVGAAGCKHFVEVRTDEPSVARVIYGNWAYGFMTGLNLSFAAAGTNTVDLAQVDPDWLLPYLDRYCGERPEGDVMTAIFEAFRYVDGEIDQLPE